MNTDTLRQQIYSTLSFTHFQVFWYIACPAVQQIREINLNYEFFKIMTFSAGMGSSLVTAKCTVGNLKYSPIFSNEDVVSWIKDELKVKEYKKIKEKFEKEAKTVKFFLEYWEKMLDDFCKNIDTDMRVDIESVNSGQLEILVTPSQVQKSRYVILDSTGKVVDKKLEV